MRDVAAAPRGGRGHERLINCAQQNRSPRGATATVRPFMRSFACLILLVSVAGCPKPREDSLEPNDSPEQATSLPLDTPLTARAIQFNPDVFVTPLQGGQGQLLNYLFESLGGDEECMGFTVTAPDGTNLYEDTNFTCAKGPQDTIRVPGANLVFTRDIGYSLVVPATATGNYFLTIEQKPQADNVFPFFTDYRINAHVVGSAP